MFKTPTKDVRVRARLPMRLSRRLVFVFRGRAYEVDAEWMTAAQWWRRPDRSEWACVSIGPFVVALRLIV